MTHLYKFCIQHKTAKSEASRWHQIHEYFESAKSLYIRHLLNHILSDGGVDEHIILGFQNMNSDVRYSREFRGGL